MAFVEIEQVTDGGTTVAHERDDTEDGGPGTSGRHRLVVDDEAGAVAAAGAPAVSGDYRALSVDLRGVWPTGIFKITALT